MKNLDTQQLIQNARAAMRNARYWAGKGDAYTAERYREIAANCMKYAQQGA